MLAFCITNIFAHLASCSVAMLSRLCEFTSLFPVLYQILTLYLSALRKKLDNDSLSLRIIIKYLLMQQVDLEPFGLSPEVANTHKYMASMGIYVFKTDVLLRLLR
jgi:hypothetical protein